MQKIYQKMNKKLVATGVAIYGVSAQAAVTMPTADYADIESAAAIGFAVALTVGLLMAARRFFK